uniref:Uncharacterized protein n=1 Tax=Cacopsylla melanoneura TaxID=428564 RepID=A0A8D8TTR0_9HEMI
MIFPEQNFTVSTLSDLYYETGATILANFSIFDARIEDFYEGCAVTLRSLKRKPFSWSDITTTLSNRVHDVLYGTYWDGKVPRLNNDPRALTVYRILDDIKRIVRENTNWKSWQQMEPSDEDDEDQTWQKMGKETKIDDYNNIPVLFYTDGFLNPNKKKKKNQEYKKIRIKKETKNIKLIF